KPASETDRSPCRREASKALQNCAFPDAYGPDYRTEFRVRLSAYFYSLSQQARGRRANFARIKRAAKVKLRSSMFAPIRASLDALLHPEARQDTLTAARHRAFFATRLFVGVAA